MNIKITRRKFIKSASVALPIVIGRGTADAKALTYPGATAQRLVLWYEKPATQWVEALPVGNGRLGAMVSGGMANERLQPNEDTRPI
jgi:alpha-L-fucosidase 2